MLTAASQPVHVPCRDLLTGISTNEAYFHAIFNSTFQLMWLIRPDGMLLEANQTAHDVGGIRQAGVKGKMLWETCWFSRFAGAQNRLEEAIQKAATGKLQRYEEEIAGKEHKTALIDFSLRPVIDNSGIVTLLIGEGRLLDEHRQAELSRQKTERQFRSFMENTPTLTWILDEFGCFRYINPGYMKAFLLTEQDVGKSIYSRFPKDICDNYIANNHRVWRTGQPLETIEEAIAPDGSRRILQVFKFPLDSENGVRLVGGTALDITQLEETKIALANSNERYHYASKATSDAIWDWDINSRFVYRGEGFRHLFNYASEHVFYKEQHACIHPADRDQVIEGLKKVLAGRKTHWQATYRFRCRDGSYKTVQDKAWILRNDAYKPVRLIGAMQDITLQQKLQKRLLEDESQRKQDIITAIIEAQEKERQEISYELHDNVNQILATCKLFLETARKEPRENGDLITLCYNNIHLVIEEIRNISRNLTPYALNDIGLVAAIKDLVEKINIARNVIVKFICPDDLDETGITADVKISLYRVMQEQLSNILKHAGASNVTVKLNRSARCLSLLVKDNGNGFNISNLQKGLGLNNIRNRVELHKGKLAIMSEPGKGCQLKIELPLQHR